MKKNIGFIKCLALLLSAAMLFSLFSCEMSLIDDDRDDDTSDEAEDNDKKGGLSVKKAEAACEDFFAALLDGDIDSVNKMVPMGTILYGGEENSLFSNGIMSSMFASVTYSIEEKEALDDGSVILKLKIENTDLKALLLSLPEGISSKEEAREKMKELLPDAARKTFDAEVILTAVGENTQITMTKSLANALTGGLNDILSELIAEEMTNETTN